MADSGTAPVRRDALASTPFAAHRFLGQLRLEVGVPPCQFLLHNHVSDLYYYGQEAQTFLPMRATLIAYLRSLGYGVIAIYNVTDGLRFAEPAMAETYEQVTAGEARAVPAYIRPTGGGSDTAPATILRGLGRLLRQSHGAQSTPFVRAAVIVERVQNLFGAGTAADERLLLDEIESWAALTNQNASVLLADVERADELPDALSGPHRSGVRVINVGRPSHAEINHLLISAARGRLALDLGLTGRERPSAIPALRVAPLQLLQVTSRLDQVDALTIAGRLVECAERFAAIGETLNLRTLRAIEMRRDEVWPRVLTPTRLEQAALELRDQVKGQSAAIERVLSMLRVAQDTLKEQAVTGQVDERLLGYVLFAGPTGVGKTEVFRVLARVFSEIPTRKFNMPEYLEPHSAARFFGAPPGYVGHGRGELGTFLCANPASIVLFDEFEKADKDVRKNFLTLLEGSLTTGDGLRVDLTQTIFIFTSNAGAAALKPIDRALPEAEQHRLRDANRKAVEKDLRKKGTPPELIGRLTENIVVFNQLTLEDVRNIVRDRLRKLRDQAGAQFDDSVEAWLLDYYLQDPTLGARRVVQHMDIHFKDEVLRHPAPRGTIFKTCDGATVAAADNRVPSNVFQPPPHAALQSHRSMAGS